MLEYLKIILLLATCLNILFTLVNLKNKKIQIADLKFLFSSFFLTLLFVLIIEIKPHHMLRISWGLSNLITYLFYFILVSIFILLYIKLILRFNFILIIISFTFFGLANAVDLLSDGRLIVFDNSEFVEDIFHIIGTVFWLMFFFDYIRKIKLKY